MFESQQQSTLPQITNYSENNQDLSGEEIKIIDSPKYTRESHFQNPNGKACEQTLKPQKFRTIIEHNVMKSNIADKAMRVNVGQQNQVFTEMVYATTNDSMQIPCEENSMEMKSYETELADERQFEEESPRPFDLYKAQSLHLQPLLKDQSNNVYLPNNGYNDFFLYLDKIPAASQDKQKSTIRDITLASIKTRRRDHLIQERR